jgi:DNA helicase-2/ATP-dependent DNA helicase PcrA
MIKSFQILAESADAFALTEHVIKKAGLVLEMKKDGTPEGIARLENLEELLNGIQDFVEGQREIDEATGSITEFLEDVALATDLDKEVGDDDRVALMTIHLAKGLEFPYVFIVGLEEDLFPSAMSMNTRAELEEERRLFYVALTRAEKQAVLTYTINRYRWGKLIDAEPSRFIEEIEDKFLDNQVVDFRKNFSPYLDTSLFGEVDHSKLRTVKPKPGKPSSIGRPTEKQLKKLRKIKPTSVQPAAESATLYVDLSVGTKVKHERFGTGVVENIEGVGVNKKAEILFESGGLKKLLLKFAKLDIIE